MWLVIFSTLFYTVPLPCLVNPWTDWIGPDPKGKTYRTRCIKRPALNGGADCPSLIEMKKGLLLCRFTVYSNILTFKRKLLFHVLPDIFIFFRMQNILRFYYCLSEVVFNQVYFLLFISLFI